MSDTKKNTGISNKISRRRVLVHALGAAAAGIVLPQFIACRGARMTESGNPVSPNDEICVGIIGCGRRNGQLAIGKGGQGAPPAHARIVAVADFNKLRAGELARNYSAKAYQDYRKLLDRKDVDVVIYVTPEHWHYLPCIHACQAGKDVYGEQPLSHTIREGRMMIEAVRKYKRVFQTGEQQRSHPATRRAVELIRNGRIGKIRSIIGYNYPSAFECNFPAQPIPSYLDWDAWCGPNEVVPYNTNLYLSRVPYERETPYATQPAEAYAVGEGSLDEQIQQVLNNLQAVLKDSGSGLDKLVRLNVYALAPATVTRVRELLSKRLDSSVRPTITSVLTPMPHRDALVALDAVAVTPDADNKAVMLNRCQAVAGEKNCADAAVLPRGGVAYFSGQPEEGTLTELAVARSMSNLMKTLGYLKLSPEHVVQIKIFLRPITSAERVLREVQKFFPGQATPPVVFVEWLAAAPIEIEMIAQLPPSGEASENVEYFTPPEVRRSNVFSKVALVHTDRQIYISGQYARVPSRGEPQSQYVFQQLQDILAKTGSDMRHLAKATYYVCDQDSARWIDRTRPKVFDPDRPPAASKLMVHAMGMEGRTMTMDMIAVGSGR